MYKRFLATVLSVSMVMGTAGWGAIQAPAQASGPKAVTPDQQAMDKLLAPIALYPDALLAQTLACAGSPQQVTEVNKWLKQNSQLKGSELQEATEKAGYDASFIALVLFPDVLSLLEKNMEWTTEVGKAFSSNQKAVLDSVQRLRAQAKAAGNLKTNPQQEVKTETQNGQTVIIVQPTNPQVVYVPVYDPQVVYVAAPPPPPASTNSSNVAAAAVIGFAAGIVLGAAMSDNYGYHGYGAWGMSWHSSVVVVHGGAWHVPPGRYPYARPVAGYHPNYNVNAPRYNNVNVNVNNNINVNNSVNNVNRQNVNTGGQTPRPTTASAAASQSRQTAAPQSSAAGTARSQPAGDVSRGRTQTASTGTASPAQQMERGSSTSAFSGYQKGSGEKAASARGKSSASAKIPSRRR